MKPKGKYQIKSEAGRKRKTNNPYDISNRPVNRSAYVGCKMTPEEKENLKILADMEKTTITKILLNAVKEKYPFLDWDDKKEEELQQLLKTLAA